MKVLTEPVQTDEWKAMSFVKSLGRPMWKYSKPNLPAKRLHGLLIIPGKPSFNASLAILFCRLGGMFSPSSDLTSDLVANHMATLFCSDRMHRQQIIGYVSDPYLAYGAKEEWLARQGFNLSDCMLPILRSVLLQGLVVQGQLGELVARIILLLLIDTCTTDKDGWVYLEAFLQKFCLESSLPFPIPSNARIGYCHFVSMVDNFRHIDLPLLGQRRAAALLKPGHRGADLLLPYRYVNSERETCWSYIIVQVKNVKNCPNKMQVEHKLQPSNVFKYLHSEKPKESANTDASQNIIVRKIKDAIGIAMCLGCSAEYHSQGNVSVTIAGKKNPPREVKEKCNFSSIPILWSHGVDYQLTNDMPNFDTGKLRDLLNAHFMIKAWRADRERSHHLREQVSVTSELNLPMSDESTLCASFPWSGLPRNEL